MIKPSIDLQELRKRMYLKAKAEFGWKRWSRQWMAHLVCLWLPSGSPAVESAPSTIGPITLEVKSTGKPGAGKPPAGFDVAGAGNVTMGVGLRAACESRGITTEPYRRRASLRPYLREAEGEIPSAYSPLNL